MHRTRYCYTGDANRSAPGGITVIYEDGITVIYEDLIADEQWTRQHGGTAVGRRWVAMTAIDSWPVEISLHEEGRETRAEARLTTQTGGMAGHGLARRNPDDQEVTQIGSRSRLGGPCLTLLTNCSATRRGRSRTSRTSAPTCRCRRCPRPSGRRISRAQAPAEDL
jgi:hypothetical protein